MAMIRLLSCLAALLAFSVAAAAAEPERVVTTPPHSQPESLTVAPDGSLILGSASKPVIYRAAKGNTEAHVFIDTSSEGAVTFLGVLADAPTNALSSVNRIQSRSLFGNSRDGLSTS
jgi:hypothetical protein